MDSLSSVSPLSKDSLPCGQKPFSPSNVQKACPAEGLKVDGGQAHVWGPRENLRTVGALQRTCLHYQNKHHKWNLLTPSSLAHLIRSTSIISSSNTH